MEGFQSKASNLKEIYEKADEALKAVESLYEPGQIPDKVKDARNYLDFYRSRVFK